MLAKETDVNIWLRDTYATMATENIQEYPHEKKTYVSPFLGHDSSTSGIIWMRGNDIYKYVWTLQEYYAERKELASFNRIIKNLTVTIYVPGLRRLYSKYKNNLLTTHQISKISTLIKDVTPRFSVHTEPDEYEYDNHSDINPEALVYEISPVEILVIDGKLRREKINYSNDKLPKSDGGLVDDIFGINVFNPRGQITEFDVVHIPLTDFIETINKNKLFEFNLLINNVHFYLDHRLYDFYDIETEQILSNKVLLSSKSRNVLPDRLIL